MTEQNINIQDKFSVEEFSKKIKEQYPEYNDMNDTVLVAKILEQYPVYKDRVNLGLKKKRFFGGGAFYIRFGNFCFGIYRRRKR